MTIRNCQYRTLPLIYSTQITPWLYRYCHYTQS